MQLKIGLSILVSNSLDSFSVIILAAGKGTRLLPLTEEWPKCLMPINGRPLLEYWLDYINFLGFKTVFVNTHFKADEVSAFLKRSKYKYRVKEFYENNLLGTAGTLREISKVYPNNRTLLIHGDNWSCANLNEFIDFHLNNRPKNVSMSMMVFKAENPSKCGIVEINKNIVVKFHEKVENPPGDLANAAIYILEPEVTDWLVNNPSLNDFSTEVIPRWLNKIAVWENKNIHRDIGTIEDLVKSQSDHCKKHLIVTEDEWERSFLSNPIHQKFKTMQNFEEKQ